MDKNQILKVRNFIMNSSEYCPSPHSVLGLDFEPSPMQIVPAAIYHCPFNDEMNSRQEKSEDHAQEAKHTMESLCKSFLKKYQNTDTVFEPIALASDFNAKLRRVYDMTNILEGGGIIEKVEKSTYKWNTQIHNWKESNVQRSDWCSLKNISSELKQLFHTIRKSFTCHQLYDILTTCRRNKFNPNTIRRRIYECCKVFLIAGLIKKAGKTFYNAKLPHSDIQLQDKRQIQENESTVIEDKNGQGKNQSLEKNIQIQKQTQIELQKAQQKDAKLPSLIDQERKSIIKKIVSDLQNQQDLYKFIADLSYEFRHRNSFVKKDFEKTQMQEQKDTQFTNSFSQKTEKNEQIARKNQDKYFSPQNHIKTIILSSPTKSNSALMFSPNSSFCSFSSKIIFESLPLDIKGK